MRMWPSKEEQRAKLPKKLSFASKVPSRTPPKFPDFSRKLGKCTENPSPKLQAKHLHLLLQNSGQFQETIFFCVQSPWASFVKCAWAEAVSDIVPFSHGLADVLRRGHCQPLQHLLCQRSGCAALWHEEMPFFPGKLCQGKGKHFPTFLVLREWQSESSPCSGGHGACGGPSPVVDITHKELSSVHTCVYILLITHILCRAGHVANGLA